MFLLKFCWRNWHLESHRVRCFLLRHTLGLPDGCVRRERSCPCGQGRDTQRPRDSFSRRTCQTLLRLRSSVLQCSSRTSLFRGLRCRRASDCGWFLGCQIEGDRVAQWDVSLVRGCPGRHLRRRWPHRRTGRWRSDDCETQCEE